MLTRLAFVIPSAILDIVETVANVYSLTGKLNYDPPRVHRGLKHLQLALWTKRAAAKNLTGNQTGIDVISLHAEHAKTPTLSRHDGTPLVGRSAAGDLIVREMIAAGLEIVITPGIRITKGVKDVEEDPKKSRRAGPAAREDRLALDPLTLA